jgi:hypothetical protein
MRFLMRCSERVRPRRFMLGDRHQERANKEFDANIDSGVVWKLQQKKHRVYSRFKSHSVLA